MYSLFSFKKLWYSILAYKRQQIPSNKCALYFVERISFWLQGQYSTNGTSSQSTHFCNDSFPRTAKLKSVSHCFEKKTNETLIRRHRNCGFHLRRWLYVFIKAVSCGWAKTIYVFRLKAISTVLSATLTAGHLANFYWLNVSESN